MTDDEPHHAGGDGDRAAARSPSASRRSAGTRGPPSTGSPPAGDFPGARPAGAPRAAPAPPHRWPWVLFVIVVARAWLVSSRVNLNYYAIQPGQAQSVQQFITVPPTSAHPVTHPVLLTDVEEARVSALSYLFYKLAVGTPPSTRCTAVTGGTAPSSSRPRARSRCPRPRQSAKTSALRHLGYPVPATAGRGGGRSGPFPGTPAYGVLDVGDVVTAVDGVADPDRRGPDPRRSSATTPARRSPSPCAEGGTGRPVPVPLTLKRTTKVEVDGPDGHPRRRDRAPGPGRLHLPLPGLDRRDRHRRALGRAGHDPRGHRRAHRRARSPADTRSPPPARWTTEGNVGDVGGVPQKTVAVENAGATIFLVPPAEYKAAMSKDRPGLKIYEVSTLDQALGVLAANGGQVAAPHGATPRPARWRDEPIGRRAVVGSRAMPEERRMTITSSPHLAPDDVARHTFASVRTGLRPGGGP